MSSIVFSSPSLMEIDLHHPDFFSLLLSPIRNWMSERWLGDIFKIFSGSAFNIHYKLITMLNNNTGSAEQILNSPLFLFFKRETIPCAVSETCRKSLYTDALTPNGSLWPANTSISDGIRRWRASPNPKGKNILAQAKGTLCCSHMTVANLRVASLAVP